MTKKNNKSIDSIREHHANNYQEEGPMGYVIKLQNRKTRKLGYIGAVPVPTDHDDNQVIGLEREGLRVSDCKNTVFERFEEASKCPYPTAEVAAVVILGLPKTKNIDYEVIPAQ